MARQLAVQVDVKQQLDEDSVVKIGSQKWEGSSRTARHSWGIHLGGTAWDLGLCAEINGKALKNFKRGSGAFTSQIQICISESSLSLPSGKWIVGDKMSVCHQLGGCCRDRSKS